MTKELKEKHKAPSSCSKDKQHIYVPYIKQIHGQREKVMQVFCQKCLMVLDLEEIRKAQEYNFSSEA